MKENEKMIIEDERDLKITKQSDNNFGSTSVVNIGMI